MRMRTHSPRACNEIMSAASALRVLGESVWLEQGKYEQAEGKYQQTISTRPLTKVDAKVSSSNVSDSIEATMSMIQQSLSANTQTSRRVDMEQRINVLEKENQQLKKDLRGLVGRVTALETRLGITSNTAVINDEGEDFDLFGDEKDEEERVVQDVEPVVKKSKKPPVVAKSTIVLEVKPWDTETDMKEVEQLVRNITKDGLSWGASKLVPVAYGIMKLQISCVVVDEKVGTDFLEDSITQLEDHVQSVDIVAFNKI